jgi:hypothetical protein
MQLDFRYCAVYGILVGLCFQITPALEFPHPCITSSREQLAVMRDKVLNEPASIPEQGWDRMLDLPESGLDYNHTPFETVDFVPSGVSESEAAFRDDAHAARSHALQWVVTGNDAHRQKALVIINDWVGTFRNWISDAQAQPQLECAWALPIWLSAADMLRYYDPDAADWTEQELSAFDEFCRTIYEEAYKARDRGNNWGVSANLAMLCYAAYTDDRNLFESSLAIAVAKLGDLSETDGEIVETCRDTHHPQYSIVSWMDAAELANNLGYPDLYEAVFDGQDTPRLALILEYFSNMFLGNTDHPCGGGWGYDYAGEYDRFDNYEVGYNHYIYREQVEYLPVFREMVEDHWRSNVGEDHHFLLWSRLTHGENDAVPVSVHVFRATRQQGDSGRMQVRAFLPEIFPFPDLSEGNGLKYDLTGRVTAWPRSGIFIIH